MATSTSNLPPIIGKRYRVYYKDPYDQVSVVEGELSRTDTQGFVVFIVNAKLIMIPTDRILLLEQI